MNVDNDNVDVNHWMGVHRRIRTQIRNMLILLASLAAFALFQYSNSLDWFSEDYEFAREFTLELEEQGARPEVVEMFQSSCADPSDDCADGKILVPLLEIPEVGWEAERYLQKQHPRRAHFTFQGFQVDIAMFALVTGFLPVIILLSVYMKLRSMRRITRLLRDECATGSEVQQCLNSVFYERVTMNLGEGAFRHALAGSLLLVVVGFISVIFSPAASQMQLNADVEITYDGHVVPLPDAYLEGRTTVVEVEDDDMLDWLVLASLAMLVLGVWIFVEAFTQVRYPKTPLPDGDD